MRIDINYACQEVRSKIRQHLGTFNLVVEDLMCIRVVRTDP